MDSFDYRIVMYMILGYRTYSILQKGLTEEVGRCHFIVSVVD